MDLYSILELDPNNRHKITIQDIKTQYKVMAKKYHPDKYKGDDAKDKFIQIHMAYEVLTDIHKKNNYDKNLKFDEHWFDIIKNKYHWTHLFFSSENEIQNDLKKLFEKKNWNEFKLSENIIRDLGEKINTKYDWKKDIILQINLNKNEFIKEKQITYIRHLHKIKGVIINFYIIKEEITFVYDNLINYDEELVTFEGKGNEIIENERIVLGDLHLDINFI